MIRYCLRAIHLLFYATVLLQPFYAYAQPRCEKYFTVRTYSLTWSHGRGVREIEVSEYEFLLLHRALDNRHQPHLRIGKEKAEADLAASLYGFLSTSVGDSGLQLDRNPLLKAALEVDLDFSHAKDLIDLTYLVVQSTARYAALLPTETRFSPDEALYRMFRGYRALAKMGRMPALIYPDNFNNAIEAFESPK